MPPSRSRLRRFQIDLLLLSVIRAYDHPDRTSEHERLAQIRDALFGEKRGPGKAPAFDEIAVFLIRNELQKPELDALRGAIAQWSNTLRTPELEAELTRSPLKAREAARKFQRFAGTQSSDESTEDRLRRKARKPKTTREMAELESLLDPESRNARIIIEILELLEKLEVRSETIWDLDP